MEKNNERLLNAIYGSEPQPKALKFSLKLDEVTISVSITKNKKEDKKCCGCNGCGGQKK